MAEFPYEPVVFSHTIESLFVRALKDELSAELSATLRELGIDLGRPLLPAYPLPVWNRALEATARALFPNDDLAAATQRLGERLAESYSTTLIGKAITAMARLIGPRRAVLRTRQNWRSGNNFSEVEITELAPSDFRLVLNETGVSRWLSAGLMKAGLAAIGAKGLQVTVEAHTETHATYRVTWQA